MTGVTDEFQILLVVYPAPFNMVGHVFGVGSLYWKSFLQLAIFLEAAVLSLQAL